MSVTRADLKWGAWLKDDKTEYEPKTGRELYDTHMICGLNRLPVILQTSYITRGAILSKELPTVPDPTLLCQQALIEGTIALLYDGLQWWPVTGIMAAREDLVISRAGYTDSGEPVTRVYSRAADSWQVMDYKYYGQQNEQPLFDAPLSIPLEQFRVFLNSIIPNGLLYPAQRTLLHIEQVSETKAILADQTIATNFFVNYGGSTEKLRSALRSKDPNIVLPEGTELLRSGGSSLYDQIMRDEDQVTRNYLLMMYLSVPDTLERVSGVAMRYSLTPQTNFVDIMRGELASVYRAFGVEITYERIVLKSTQERNELMTLYATAQQALAAAGVPLLAQEYAALIRELL